MTWDQVATFRLARHHLLECAATKDLTSVAYDMTAAQAQLLSAAQISPGVRVHDLQVNGVEDAIPKRKLVKASCMRRTLFLVPAKHLAVFVRSRVRPARGKRDSLVT